MRAKDSLLLHASISKLVLLVHAVFGLAFLRRLFSAQARLPVSFAAADLTTAVLTFAFRFAFVARTAAASAIVRASRAGWLSTGVRLASGAAGLAL